MGALLSLCPCCWPELPPVGEKDPAAVAAAVRLLDRVYEYRSFDFTYEMGKYEEQLKQSYALLGSEKACVYGEVHPFGAVNLFHAARVRPGQRFYDLGSGTGKIVLLARLLGLQATGVEILSERWDASCKALERLRALAPGLYEDGVDFVQASALDVDFSDADLVLCTDLLWPEELRASLATVVASRLKPGTLVVTILPLDGPGLELSEEVLLATNWNEKCRFCFQRVTGAPAAEDTLQDPLKT